VRVKTLIEIVRSRENKVDIKQKTSAQAEQRKQAIAIDNVLL